MGNAEWGSRQSSLQMMSPYRLPAATCPPAKIPTFCCFDQALDSGMGYPECNMKQVALPMMDPLPLPPAPTCPPILKNYIPLILPYQSGKEALMCRLNRRIDAELFRSHYTYGSSSLVNGCNQSMDQKTCIWSCGTKTWLDQSSGIMWVAVHGRDSICLVTRNEFVDKTRVGGLFEFDPEWQVNRLFREALISEVEDLADPSRRKFDLNIEKPFAVVSVIPVTKVREGSDHEESSPVYDEKGAIEFLLEKIKSGSTFNFIETVQTAISGFLHLSPRELKANDIQAWVVTECDYPWQLQILDGGEYLTVIRCPSGDTRDAFTVERQSKMITV